MNNQQYDNTFSNAIVGVVGVLVRILERSFVVFWDGLRNATMHGTPSLLGFIAAVSPIVAPLWTAIQTAHSLAEFMHQPVYQAVIGAIALEFIGFELWVFLTEILMNKQWEGSRIQYALAGGVIVYELALILVNVILMAQNETGGDVFTQVVIMFAMCLLPALAAIGYGYINALNKATLARLEREQKELAEKIRQERRQDKKERDALRAEATFRKAK
jgi:hypothetical protein